MDVHGLHCVGYRRAFCPLNMPIFHLYYLTFVKPAGEIFFQRRLETQNFSAILRDYQYKKDVNRLNSILNLRRLVGVASLAVVLTVVIILPCAGRW